MNEKRMRIKKDGYFLYVDEQNKPISVQFYDFNENAFFETKDLPITKLFFCSTCELKDFDFLSEYKLLKNIIIEYNHKRVPVEIFNKLNSLENLGLPEFVGTFSNPNVREFGYKWTSKSIVSSECRGIVDIQVLNCKDTDSAFKQLSQLPNLKSMWLFRSGLTDFAIDRTFVVLERLEILYSSKLLNFDGIDRVFPNLKFLWLEHAPKVSDYSGLAKLKDLEELVIAESAPIADLSFLTEMKKLKTLRIVQNKILSTDFSPLESILKNISDDFAFYHTGVDKEILKWLKGIENEQLK